MKISRTRPARPHLGFTLVELVMVVALVGTLAGLSVSTYLGYVEKARVASAVAEIGALSRLIEGEASGENATLPASLADIGQDHFRDPWGRPYQYLRLATVPSSPTPPPVSASPPPPPGGSPPSEGPSPTGDTDSPNIGEARKDGFLVPLNSDFDLYSLGRDGRSRVTLRAPESLDDVIRAADGSYIGLAEHY